MLSLFLPLSVPFYPRTLFFQLILYIMPSEPSLVSRCRIPANGVKDFSGFFPIPGLILQFGDLPNPNYESRVSSGFSAAPRRKVIRDSSEKLPFQALQRGCFSLTTASPVSKSTVSGLLSYKPQPTNPWRPGAFEDVLASCDPCMWLASL